EPLVRDDQVAAPTEHQQRLAALVRRPDLGHDLRLGGRLDQPASGTAEPQGGVVRERDLLTDTGAGPCPARQLGVGHDQGRRTTARARVSTLAPPETAVRLSVTRLPSSFSSTVPLTSIVAPTSSSGTTTGAENRTPNSTSAPASPAQSVMYL